MGIHCVWPPKLIYSWLLQIYDTFEQRARIMINRYIRDNSLVKK